MNRIWLHCLVVALVAVALVVVAQAPALVVVVVVVVASACLVSRRARRSKAHLYEAYRYCRKQLSL